MRWLFVLAATTGARLDELAQLTTDAVATEDGIVHLRIRGNGIKLKNSPSARLVPVPSAVLQLGLMRYVRATSGALFGEYKRDRDGKASTAASKKCVAVIRAAGVRDRDFHGLRHYVIDTLREAEIDPFLARRITGHTAKDAHSGYGRGYSLKRLLDALDALPTDFLPLSMKAVPPTALAAE